MDFGKFDKVENTFPRLLSNKATGASRKQSFDFLSYKKSEKIKKGTEEKVTVGHFFMASSFFVSANLTEKGLCQFTTPDGKETVLAVVEDKYAEIMKLTKKGKSGNKVKNFKSPKLEAALATAGLIDESVLGERQTLDLELVGTNVEIKGVPCISVYSFKKGTAKEATTKEAITAAPVAEAEKSPEVAPAPAPVADNW